MSAPLWLLALLAIPLIRWLHRWQAPLSSTWVSATFLWDSATGLSAGGESRQKPDPAWWRRGLIAALLALALAQPWWQRDTGVVTVWIDDSLSMSAIENGESRLAAGLVELEEALNQSGAAQVGLRSLSNPASTRSSDEPGAFDAAVWLSASRVSPDPPPAALLSRGSAHWLVTDGASARVVEWATRAPLDRIFQLGAATENVAVTRLSARRSMRAPRIVDLLIAVSNPGRQEANRELVLQSGSNSVATWALTLSAGETRYIQASQRITDAGLTAVISPGDLVTEDDSVSLATSEIDAIAVALDAACPAELSLAIRSHPGLGIVTDGAPAELQLDCADRPVIAGSRLRFHVSAYSPVDVAPAWRPGLRRMQGLQLARDWVAAAEWGTRLDGDYETLLSAGETPLVIRRSIPPFDIETVLDMSRAEFAGQPEYAAVIAGLIDLTLGSESLGAVAASARPVAESRIEPTEIFTPATEAFPHGSYRQSLAGPLLLLAVLVVLADMLLLWRAGREARRG